MNRANLLVASAAVALVAATSASTAQQERMPQQERGAPAEKMAPKNAPASRNQGPTGVGEQPQNRGRTETTGRASREEGQNRPGERNSQQERSRTEQPLRSERNERNRTTGQAPREDRLNRAPEHDRTTGQAPREDRTNRSSGQNRLEENRATTGQGAAGTRAGVNLTRENRTRIHDVVIHQRNAPRVSSPHFSVSVGARVPRTVRFAALPRTIVEIEPAWRGFEYFLIGDQIVIVDPRSMEIVAIVEA